MKKKHTEMAQPHKMDKDEAFESMLDSAVRSYLMDDMMEKPRMKKMKKKMVDMMKKEMAGQEM